MLDATDGLMIMLADFHLLFSRSLRYTWYVPLGDQDLVHNIPHHFVSLCQFLERQCHHFNRFAITPVTANMPVITPTLRSPVHAEASSEDQGESTEEVIMLPQVVYNRTGK